MQPERRTIVAAAAALYLTACQGACPGPMQPPPPGAIVCGADSDCPGYVTGSQHCGYEGVDRPFICLDGPPDNDPLALPRRDGGR